MLENGLMNHVQELFWGSNLNGIQCVKVMGLDGFVLSIRGDWNRIFIHSKWLSGEWETDAQSVPIEMEKW